MPEQETTWTYIIYVIKHCDIRRNILKYEFLCLCLCLTYILLILEVCEFLKRNDLQQGGS